MAKDGNPFQFRPGINGFPRWRGVNKQGRPSSIQPNELRDGINLRFSGDDIVNRGGQSQLSANTVTGCVFGIHENPSQWQSVKFYAASDEPTTVSYSQEDDPVVQTITDTCPSSARNLGYVAFNGLLHYASGLTLYKVEPIPVLPGQDQSDVGGLTRAVKLATLADSANTSAVMPPTLDDDDNIFIGSTTNGEVYRWDGTSIIEDTGTALGASPQVLVVYHEDLFVFGNHYANKRAGGAYTSVSMPGGLTSFRPFDAVIYKDVLYIAGYDRVSGTEFNPKILSYNGTALAVARSPSATGTVGEADEGVRSLAVFNGFLFYGWRDPGSGSGLGKIGRFDGSSWVDDHKVLHTQFGNTQTMSLLAQPYSLFAIAWECSGSAKIVESPGTTTSGTWVDRGTLGTQAANLFAF